MVSFDPFVTKRAYRPRRRLPLRTLPCTPRAVLAWGVLLPAFVAGVAFATNSAPASLVAIGLVLLGWVVPYQECPPPRRRRRRPLPHSERLDRLAAWAQILGLPISLAALVVALIALLTDR